MKSKSSDLSLKRIVLTPFNYDASSNLRAGVLVYARVKQAVVTEIMFASLFLDFGISDLSLAFKTLAKIQIRSPRVDNLSYLV